MPGTHITKEEISEAVRLFNLGISIKSISDQLGRTEERISSHLKRAGVWSGKSPKFTEDQLSEMKLLLSSGESLQSIGDRFGVSYNSIYHALQRIGVSVSVPLSSMVHQKEMAYDLSEIPDEWWAEFRGFFYGEGTVVLTGTGGRLSIQVRVLLRDDDRDVVNNIHSVLGGTVSHYTPKQSSRNSNPNCVWVCTGLSKCLPILEKLSGGLMPAKKIRDIKLAIEFCYWRLSCPRHLSLEQHRVQEEYREKMKQIKVYRTY